MSEHVLFGSSCSSSSSLTDSGNHAVDECVQQAAAGHTFTWLDLEQKAFKGNGKRLS